MINNLKILSIKIMNSQYRFILNLLASLIIYICFSGNFNNVVLCTNDNLPAIAEPKIPIIKGTVMPSPLQTEVGCFLDQAGTISEQQKELKQLAVEKTVLQFRNNVSDLTLISSRQQTTSLLIENTQLSFVKAMQEEKIKVYKEGFEQSKRVATDLLNSYPQDIKRAYNSGYRACISDIALLTVSICLTAYIDHKYGLNEIAGSISKLLLLKK